MKSKKRILVLGTSPTGGDWPPVACVAQGLLERRHELSCFADSVIRSTIQHLDMPVVVPTAELEFGAYAARWMAGHSEQEVLELLERTSFLTALRRRGG